MTANNNRNQLQSRQRNSESADILWMGVGFYLEMQGVYLKSVVVCS